MLPLLLFLKGCGQKRVAAGLWQRYNCHPKYHDLRCQMTFEKLWRIHPIHYDPSVQSGCVVMRMCTESLESFAQRKAHLLTSQLQRARSPATFGVLDIRNKLGLLLSLPAFSWRPAYHSLDRPGLYLLNNGAVRHFVYP